MIKSGWHDDINYHNICWEIFHEFLPIIHFYASEFCIDLRNKYNRAEKSNYSYIYTYIVMVEARGLSKVRKFIIVWNVIKC